MGSKYLLQLLETALGRKGKATATGHPLWDDFTQKEMLAPGGFPSFTKVSDVEDLLSGKRVCIIVGAERDEKTALARAVGYKQTQANRDVWYLDMSQTGYQDLSTVCETIRAFDAPGNLFIVDNCQSDLADAKSLLELSIRETRQAKIIMAASFARTDARLQEFLRLVDSEQVITVDSGVRGSEASSRPVISRITSEMFQDAKRQAEHELKELQDQELSFGIDSTEYRDYCNSKAFIGHMPEWRHLFMGAFGAFPRPKKESDLLSAINKNAEKLDTRRNGLLFHVVSGDSGSGNGSTVTWPATSRQGRKKAMPSNWATTLSLG